MLAYMEQMISRYSCLETIRDSFLAGYGLMEEAYAAGGKLLIAGNGGSAADAEHIAGELMKSFCLPHPVDEALARRLQETDPVRGGMLAQLLQTPLPAIPLTGRDALSTAYINDVDAACVYAQQLLGLGKSGDVFLGISTSGNSENVLCAAVTARAMGLRVIALTGEDGGRLAQLADVTVKAPQRETYLVQELHLPIYHCWCRMLETHFFERTESNE